MIPIKSIGLVNFKAYKSQSFELSTLSVFCGSNSVGKSTAIQAIGMFLQSDFWHNFALKINGDLVNIGNLSDIQNVMNRNADKLTIQLESANSIFKWGYENSEAKEKLSGNELPLIKTNINTDSPISLKEKINFQYLQADRYGPRDNCPIVPHNRDWKWLGTQGEHAIAVLQYLEGAKVIHLSLKDSPEGDPRQHEASLNDYVINNIQAWMGEIAPNHKISPQTIPRANIAYNSITPSYGEETKPVNIGYGFSYALSIVTALLLADPDEIVIIESPEAHLHPRGQSYLGRLIALTALAGVQVIIETHSDHILNGIRVVTRLAANYKEGSSKVFFIKTEDKETKVDVLPIGAKGELPFWPVGFFDQQALDVKAIIKGRASVNQDNS